VASGRKLKDLDKVKRRDAAAKLAEREDVIASAEKAVAARADVAVDLGDLDL